MAQTTQKKKAQTTPEKNDSTEQRIIRAAAAIFIAKGFDGARMQEIADSAGINKALLHYYFRSKELLFQTVFETFAREFSAPLLPILASNKPFVEKIRHFVAEEVEQLCRKPEIPMFIVREITRDADHFRKVVMQSHIGDIFALFTKEVKAAVKKKEIIAIEPAELLLNVFALIRFPFIARPMFTAVAGLSEEQYQSILHKRKHDVAEFIIRSIQP